MTPDPWMNTSPASRRRPRVLPPPEGGGDVNAPLFVGVGPSLTVRPERPPPVPDDGQARHRGAMRIPRLRGPLSRAASDRGPGESRGCGDPAEDPPNVTVYSWLAGMLPAVDAVTIAVPNACTRLVPGGGRGQFARLRRGAPVHRRDRTEAAGAGAQPCQLAGAPCRRAFQLQTSTCCQICARW